MSFYQNSRNQAQSAQVLRRYSQQLTERSAQLEQSNQKLQRFAGSISHDILSNIDLLLSTGHILVSPDKKPAALSHFYDQAMQALGSTKAYCLKLLQSAREQKQGARRCDANRVLQAALEHNQIMLQSCNIKVSSDHLPEAPMRDADLLQVFQNLLSNAIAFACPQPDAQIAIQGKQANGEVRIGVLDNGPGIPDGEMGNVFNLGVSHREGGHGEGLAIVRDIVKSYGGRVWAERSELGGAAIWLALPDVSG